MSNAQNEGVGKSMFRAMKTESDCLPRVGRSSRELGVRVEGSNADIPVREDGVFEPRTGGISVALDRAQNLPKPRIPKSLGGEGRDPVFTMNAAQLPFSLALRPHNPPHALVEPSERCSLNEFESNLAKTRPHWSISHE